MNQMQVDGRQVTTSGGEKKVLAHKMVADVAKGIAEDLYETMMGDDFARSKWKRLHPGMGEKGLIKAFVKKYLPACLTPARTALTGLLTKPHIDEESKERIIEALILDASLGRDKQ